jgi:cell surface protein SprA
VSAVGGRGVEFSERSLALRVRGLAGGDRVEVYSRFFQRPRDFLAYRELRLWALARDGDFGHARERGLRVFLKVGSDPENFYLWTSPWSRPPTPAA